jgi:hypothetical protein
VRVDHVAEMSRDSQTPGPLLATLGAGGALLSLWAPWYSFQIPQELLNRAAAVAGQFGILGPAIQQYTLEARAMGPFHLTAWDVFHQIDVIVAVVAAVAAIFAVLAFTGRGTGTGKLIALAGAIVVLLAGYRIISPPGPDGLLHVMWGAYATLACGAVALIGGLLTADSDEREEQWTPAAAWSQGPAPDASWGDASSVPPPAR